MRKYSILILLIFIKLSAFACPACGKQQPKVLEGITHGAGPDSNWDYLIVGIMVVVTLYVLYATIKCLIKPAEKNENHIKRMVLNDFDQ
jgi:hypothetical protein